MISAGAPVRFGMRCADLRVRDAFGCAPGFRVGPAWFAHSGALVGPF